MMAPQQQQAPGIPRPFLECIDIGKRFAGRGGEVEALRGVNLASHPGEFVCLLGASGCGKSTLLQIVAGLESATQGHIVVSGREIDGPSRDLSFVFQDHGLFPWMTVERNVAFNLKARGVGRAERRDIAARFLDMVGLGPFAKRYPHELSGGMKQRVGIARALTTSPKLLLMDEPFGALDAQTRANLQAELLRIWQATGTTVLFVTHSIDEAVILADRIVVFHPRPGRIRAVVPVPLDRPRDVHAAAFSVLCRELEALVVA
jgi:NitT/TauT family transport system ATP-binding protein